MAPGKTARNLSGRWHTVAMVFWNLVLSDRITWVACILGKIRPYRSSIKPACRCTYNVFNWLHHLLNRLFFFRACIAHMQLCFPYIGEKYWTFRQSTKRKMHCGLFFYKIALIASDHLHLRTIAPPSSSSSSSSPPSSRPPFRHPRFPYSHSASSLWKSVRWE